MKNHTIFSMFVTCAVLASGIAQAETATATDSIAAEVAAAQQARSVHLNFAPIAPNATEARGSVTVTETQTNTYFAIVCCDGAYCGIQDIAGRYRIFLFSVWEPSDPMNLKARQDIVPEAIRAEVLSSDPQTHVTRFGGEGTGAKTMTDIGWKVGERVSAWIGIKPYGKDRTLYTCRVRVGDGQWREIASITTIGVRRGLGNVYCFVEDFWRNGHSASLVRRAEFGDFESRLNETSEWIPCTRAQFTGDNNPIMNIDAGKVPTGGMFLQTGGATRNINVPLWGTVK